MSRRTIVILILVALAAAIVALVVWLTSRSNATGQVVELAAQAGAEPETFRSGRDLATATRLHRDLLREIAVLASTPQGAGSERFRNLHNQLAAVERLYPSLRGRA